MAGEAIGIRREGSRVLVIYGDRTSDRIECRSAALSRRLAAYLTEDPAQVDRTARGFVRRMVQLAEATEWSGRRRAGGYS